MPGAADEPEKISRGQRKSEGLMTQILYRLFSLVQEPPHIPFSPPRLLLLSEGNVFMSFDCTFLFTSTQQNKNIYHMLRLECTAATNNYFYY